MSQRVPASAPAPFIVGVSRSGTTLVRLILDAHPDLAIPPETGFAVALLPRLAAALHSRRLFAASLMNHPLGRSVWNDFEIAERDLHHALRRVDHFSLPEGLRAFYCLYAAQQGKPRWGDKTPNYVGHMPAIAALFPEARFIHLIRDGRDVAVSLRRQWFAPSIDIGELAAHWVASIRRARASTDVSVLEVRFEDLVADVDGVTATMCDFVDLPFVAGLDDPKRRATRLRAHGGVHSRNGRFVVTKQQRALQQSTTGGRIDAGKVGSWRVALTADEIALFESIAGDLLRELGY